MTSVQERLQLKREPIDKWSIREQLCLASAVCRSGDQNWMSVSRALKPFGEPNRPLDWFHQKNCAAQYGMLLGNVETPKRKNKKTCIDSGIETPAESILKRLVSERQVELKKLLVEEKNEYQKLQKDMIVLQSGKVTEEQLDRWCQEIEEEENRKEHEIATHAQWLKEREHRKLEIEKVWRPVKAAATGAAAVVGVAVTGQKRKNSDVLDNLEQHVIEEVTVQHQPVYAQTPEPAKPALSPLLTSLLKSPSQVQSTPILHTAITNRPNTNTNPMIASLLNSSTGVTVSPGLQQLVSSAIGQETPNLIQQQQHQQNIQYQQQQQILQQQQQQHHQHDQQQQQQQQQITNDILDDANMANIKIEDLANSILSQDGPLPEIKKEEVDDIISEIIQADPERHLQLDNNGDININLELDDFDDDDDVLDEIRQQQQQRESIDESKIDKKSESESKFVSSTPIVDPFEFQEDPVIHLEPSIKVSGISKQPQYQQQQSGQNEIGVGNNSPVKDVQELGSNDEENFIPLEIDDGGEKIGEETTLNVNPQQPTKEPPQNDPPQTPQQQQQQPPPQIKQEESPVPGSVEIVEVVVTDDDEDADVDDDDVEIDVDKNFAKSDIVNSIKSEDSDVDAKIKCEEENSKDTGSGSMVTFEESSETSEFEVKKEIEERASGAVVGEERADVKIEFNRDELLFDEINMEVKFDKSGKKRDYSRTKKKDEKGFDILLAIEKAHFEESEQTTDETFTDTTTPTPMTSTDVDNKKDPKLLKIKSEIERSNSPWTEEEDGGAKYGGGGVGGGSSKRRYSTPVTPTDSIPNSPASSNAATFFDEDREHRNWKKSVMLVYNRLATHKYASLFLKPITDDHAPGYSNTVYRPMDLLTIKKNIENGTLRSTLEFKRDAILMFMNALMYNRTNSLVYTMALEMQQECTEPLEILMMAENHKDSSLRRETRTSELGTKRKRTLTDEILLKSTTKKRKDD